VTPLEAESLTNKMIVMKNKFILRKAAIGAPHQNKAAHIGEEIQDAFCRNTGRMRFSFGSIAGGQGVLTAKN